jgi:Flp pilus assembly protein TadB
MISSSISTLLLTFLLLIGLFFFIRASVKDRTETVKLLAEEPQDSVLQQLQQYFSQRSYRVSLDEGSPNQLIFEGIVRPSWFLAVFLTLLAAIGLLCLALVLAFLFPAFSHFFFFLILVSPLTGWFYWRGAKRPERISLKVEAVNGVPGESVANQSLITLVAHRDELEIMQRNFPFKCVEESV